MRELFIESDDFELRSALCQDGRLVWLEREVRQRPSVVGSIYHGKVRRVVEGIDGAFVDIGIDRDAFLQFVDLGTDRREDIGDLISPGERILVQVTRDRRGKGPRVTTRIGLPGYLLVLLPTGDGVAWSRKIEVSESRRRAMEEVLSRGPAAAYGWIVRTAGEDVPEPRFEREAHQLVDEWQRILSDYRESKHPHCLNAELDLARRALRDLNAVDRVVVQGPVAELVVDWLAASGRRAEIEVEDRETSLFAHSGLDPEIARLQKPWVDLPSGGSLVIESTEAMVAIDVNSGSDINDRDFERTALATNLEAADEVALQLRARGLGGLIAIDFIDMRSRDNREQLLDHLRRSVADDPHRVQVGGMSRFGLVDLTRRQGRSSYFEQSQRSCPSCSGRGKVPSIGALRSDIRHRLAKLAPGERVELRAAPETAHKLGDLSSLVPPGTAPPALIEDPALQPSQLVWRNR